MALPAWAKETAPNSAEVQVEQAYPLYLKELEQYLPASATPAFASAVAKVCIARDLRANGYTYIRFKGDKTIWGPAARNNATTAEERETAAAEFDRGQRAAGRIRDKWMKKRATAIFPE